MKLKRLLLNVVAWVAFAVGIGMILWKVFGNSPTVAEILVPFVVFSLMKVWDNNGSITDVGYKVEVLSVNTKHAFEKVGVDIKRMESKIDGLVKK